MKRSGIACKMRHTVIRKNLAYGPPLEGVRDWCRGPCRLKACCRRPSPVATFCRALEGNAGGGQQRGAEYETLLEKMKVRFFVLLFLLLLFAVLDSRAPLRLSMIAYPLSCGSLLLTKFIV